MDARITCYFLNVGQGDGFLIVFPNEDAILIDGGSNSAVLQTYLRAIPCNVVMVLLTHNDQDHVLAFLNTLISKDFDYFADVKYIGYVIDRTNDTKLTDALHTEIFEFETKQLNDYPEFKAQNLRCPEKPFFIPLDSEIGDVAVQILHPEIEPQEKLPETNKSCIIARFVYGEKKILFGADLEPEQWDSICKSKYASYLEADVFTVSHHGGPSRDFDDDLLKWTNLIKDFIKPKHAFVSVGTNNQPKHPVVEYLIPLLTLPVCLYCSNSNYCHEDSTQSLGLGKFTFKKSLLANQVFCMGTMIAHVSTTDISIENQAEHKAQVDRFGKSLCDPNKNPILAAALATRP